MKVLYFTSTGNCLMVAKQIGGELISIPQAVRNNNYKIEDEAIGMVFPVYGLSVPPLILEFIKKAEFKTKYLFAVITCGTYDAGTVTQFLQESEKRGNHFSYVNCLHMQENYIPGFAMEKQSKPKDQDEKLGKICREIKARTQYIKKNSWFDRFMTKTHQANYHYLRGEGVVEKYQVTDVCKGCGACEKVCPTNNVHISDGRPVFGGDCLSCLACTQNCPVNAIRLAGEKSEARYRNPEVQLSEIMEANR